jgi:hypothetical protein
MLDCPARMKILTGPLGTPAWRRVVEARRRRVFIV